MKKRIFIAMHYLEIGGAETSLIGLLHSFDYSKYDVDLFLYAHQGELIKYIPKEVHILKEIKGYKQIESPIIQVIKQGGLCIAAARLWARIKYINYIKKHRLGDNSVLLQYIQDAVSPFLPSLKKFGCYDLAISFLIPHRIVLEKVQARKKIAWIHTDYSTFDVDVPSEKPIWSKYDYIASISEDVTKGFLKKFPSLANKIILIENILSKHLVKSRAQETVIQFSKENERINMLSIGRYAYPKNFDNIPYICAKIRELGFNVYWYIIGFGAETEHQKIIEAINKTEMKDYVFLLGKKDNPYPYIQACDIYVQPSRYEGKSVTVREAQMLGKPVVITNYPTANSQITNGEDGIIVPLDNDQCASGIANFLRNKRLQQYICQNLKKNDYSNQNEIHKLYNLI